MTINSGDIVHPGGLSRLEYGRPPLLDFSAALILWIGMLMFAIEFRYAGIQYTWVVLAIGTAVYVVVSSWRGRRKELASPESELTQPIIAIADIGVCFMLLPALTINIVFGLAPA